MAFDGAFLHKTVTELQTAENTFVDKIYQPSKDELVFLLRKSGFCKKLLINVRPGAARIQFTETKYENPAVPPMFCMLIRKYLSSARLLKVSQPGFERIAELTFSYTNEMGDIAEIRLAAEFIGNKTNIVLINENGKIIDALRHSDPESGGRMILPGAAYTYPEQRHKLDPLNTAAEKIIEAAEKSSGELSSALLNTVDGFSPLLCREAVYKAELSGNLTAALGEIISDLKNSGTPLLLIKSDGTPQDFSFTDISQYGSLFEKKVFQSYSQLLEEFYSARDTADRMKHAAGDILKLVNNLKTRTEKKLALRLQELKSCENREQLRIYGELLKANLYKSVPGAAFIEVENYYDNMKQIRIPLDPALSPQKNAAKYFKDYKKSHTAEQTLTELTRRDEQELIYFDSVLDSISRSRTKAEITEIREELTAGGYLKSSASKPKKAQAPVIREYRSAEGYRIIVGKNNRQNDYITTTLAAKNDLWFHTKNIPGSHVVVMCGGKEVSDETLVYAATLAAENSSAAAGAQVPVDYTPIKFVKKPNGAKPGMVIYTTNKTLYVTPDNGGKL